MPKKLKLSPIKITGSIETGYRASAEIDYMDFNGEGPTKKDAILGLKKDALLTINYFSTMLKLNKELVKRAEAKAKNINGRVK